MLIIHIKPNGFSVKGHAGFAPHGQDIICSAVSFLAQSVHEELCAYDAVTSHQESGNMDVELLTISSESKVLLNYFENSALLLASNFPNNVQIKRNS